ncbi:MAG: hypothetical protein CMJ52_09605 [Planctomycetaceae bacterium]|nr:hypothetical protein [Planctomycetaceae bacterium]
MSVVPAEIEIEVVLHALLRELVEEAGPIRLGLPTGATPASAFAAAAERHPALAAHASTVAFARDDAVIRGDATLRDGDRLEVLPPVSGG